MMLDLMDTRRNSANSTSGDRSGDHHRWDSSDYTKRMRFLSRILDEASSLNFDENEEGEILEGE